ncbi:molybdopterin-dependent oxidoreductase [Pseudonocardia sp. MCCB 268]|nr:molybdopterin-dependent oxidoreductase [Pseudonocardia cytotoxica]
MFVRSPLAPGRITGIDINDRGIGAGVVAVFTAADLDLPAHRLHGREPAAAAAAAATTDQVRFVGDSGARHRRVEGGPAVVRGRTGGSRLRPVARVVDPEAALGERRAAVPGSARTWWPGARSGTRADPLADAELVVRARMVSQRIAVVPMEEQRRRRQADRGQGSTVVVHISTQMPHGVRASCATMFRLPRSGEGAGDRARGGRFGGKPGDHRRAHRTTVGAARALGRPVAWVETRSNLVSMPHGRGQVGYEAGPDAAGKITGCGAGCSATPAAGRFRRGAQST